MGKSEKKKQQQTSSASRSKGSKQDGKAKAKNQQQAVKKQSLARPRPVPAPSPSPNTSTATTTSTGNGSGGSKLSALQQQFARKLEGARFRSINEDLYSNPGHASFADFQQHPEKFHLYHTGYREQAAVWPINPLDLIIDWISAKHKGAVVADMGCGEARLSASLPNRVHSFDLVAANDRVTACDMAHVPLADGSVDIVVFCLSLMGTNLVDFIKEARRILKVGGLVKIIEVRSRFQDNKGIKRFIRFLKGAGFTVKQEAQLLENVMFFDVEAAKNDEANPSFDWDMEVKSCLYKKR